MLIVVGITFRAELAVVVREKVSSGAEIKFVWKKAFHTRHIFPHQVFATNLKRLREVVNFLISGSFLEVVGLRCSRPHDVPLRAVRTNDATARSF